MSILDICITIIQNFGEFRPLKAEFFKRQNFPLGIIEAGVSEKFACVVY